MRSIVIREDKATGKVSYITGSPVSFTFTPDREKAVSFKAEAIIPALKYAKKSINPNDTRVYTASA